MRQVEFRVQTYVLMYYCFSREVGLKLYTLALFLTTYRPKEAI